MPRLPLAHLRKHSPGRVVGAVQVNRDQFVPDLRSQLRQISVGSVSARREYQDIDWTARLPCLLSYALHVPWLGCVSGCDLYRVALTPELLLQLLQPVLAARGCEDTRAFTGEQNGGFTADAAGRADDKYRLTLQ